MQEMLNALPALVAEQFTTQGRWAQGDYVSFATEELELWLVSETLQVKNAL